MGTKPKLTDDEVLQIVRLYTRGMSLRGISSQFHRSPDTIRLIVTGKSYRHVTAQGHAPGGDCECFLCEIAKREGVNLKIADAATTVFYCLGCGKPLQVRVTAALRDHGTIRCIACGGRYK